MSEYWTEDSPGTSWTQASDGLQDYQEPGVIPFLEISGLYSIGLVIVS